MGVCGFPLRWARAQDVVEEMLWRSPPASVITGVTEPLPICVPNKERPPSLRLLSPHSPASFPLHLPNLLSKHSPFSGALLLFYCLLLFGLQQKGFPSLQCAGAGLPLAQFFLSPHPAVLYPLVHACDFCLVNVCVGMCA